MDLDQVEAEIKEIESKISALVFKKNILLKLKAQKINNSKAPAFRHGEYVRKRN